MKKEEKKKKKKKERDELLRDGKLLFWIFVEIKLKGQVDIQFI